MAMLQNPFFMFLIPTSDFNLVGNLKYEAPFNKGDHLTFLFVIKNFYSAKKNNKPERLDFNRIDYNELINDQSKMQWFIIFNDSAKIDKY